MTQGGPLAGLRIIEIAGIGPLPFAGMLLADLGAEILRIEGPRPRELHLPHEDPLMRGRASLILDLKSDEGSRRLLDLVKRADVLLEGLRPGKLEALGLGPEECLQRAPWLVYGRATGWGQEGHLAAFAGHDPNYVSYTGALDWLVRSGQSAMPPFGLVGDTAGGALYLVMGVLAAVLHARNTGQGQVVDASIFDGTLSLLTSVFAAQRDGRLPRSNWARLMTGESPFATAYETADAKQMVVCALESRFYEALLAGLALDPASLPDRNDPANWERLYGEFARRFASAPRSHWEAVFGGNDACASPVLSLEEAPDHPVNRERDSFENGLPRSAPRFSATPIGHAAHSREAEILLQEWENPSGDWSRPLPIHRNR